MHFIDILLVAVLVFWTLKLIRNTRAWRVVGGVAIFVILLFLSDFFHLRTVHWMLDKATVLGPVALVILLLPELRQALEGFARLGLWPNRNSNASQQLTIRSVDDIVASVVEMAASRVGALIVIERNHTLDDVIHTGVTVDSTITSPLLTTIFSKGSPLHDGAVVLRGDRVAAAAARLPLSDNEQLSKKFHMRHRAAVGLSEVTDALVLIVSEERSEVSIAVDGAIRTLPNPDAIRQRLLTEMDLVAKPSRSSRRKRENSDAK